MASATKIAVSMAWKAQNWLAGCMVSVSPQSAHPPGIRAGNSEGRASDPVAVQQVPLLVASPRSGPATLMRRRLGR